MAVNYTQLARAYKALNRLGEAEAVDKQMRERKLEHEGQFRTSYWLAFLKGECGADGADRFHPPRESRARRTVCWPFKRTPKVVRQAEERSRTDRAGDGFSAASQREGAAAAYQAEAALREVESGYREQARAEAEAAVKLA